MRLDKNIKFYQRMVNARLKKLSTIGPFIKGSLVKIPHTCGNKNCRCARGEKHQSYYLTYKVKQKTKTIYVPVDLVKEVEKWTKEYKHIKELMEEVTELQRIIIRKYVKEKRGKKKV